jgi:hypothetical protein
LWEYKVVNSDAHRNDIFSAIARAGKEGWELVGQIGFHIYLKRPLEPK